METLNYPKMQMALKTVVNDLCVDHSMSPLEINW